MKKRLFITLFMIAMLSCLFAISISAAPRNYQSYEVELVDGSRITVYETGCWDQWQGHVHLSNNTYTEAPLDTDGTYPLLDWSKVKTADFTNAWGNVYNASTGEWELKAGTNGGFSFFLEKSNFTPENATNLEKIILGKLTLVNGASCASLPALKEVIAGENLTNIAWNAFSNCKSLTTVSFAENSNKFKTFGQQAFLGCTSLVNFSMPDTVTSIGDKLFTGCTSLKSVKWSSSLNKIPNHTFEGCTSLMFEIPENVTAIGNSAFKDCDSLVSVTIPDCVTNLGSAFGYCDNLEKINISDNSLVSNKLIALAEYCPKLTSIRIPPLVTELGYDNFRGCTSLSEVIWPNNLTAITGNQNFTNCAFTSFTFPNSLTTLGGGNLTGNAIEELRLGNSLTNLDNSIFLFKTLKRVYIPASITTVGKQLLGWSNPADSSYNITFIFTGTMEQAISMQNTLESTQDTNNAPNNSKFYDAILVSASEYDVTQEPSGYHFVYGYSTCDAFYNGNHIMSTDYKLHFVDFTTSFYEYSVCTVCPASSKVNAEDYAPIFSGFRYSVKENDTALYVEYAINGDSLSVYNSYNENAKLSYGIVASLGLTEGETLLTLDNGSVVKSKENAVLVGICDEYSGVTFIIRGFNESHNLLKLVMCAYASDGKDIYYIGNTVSKTPFEISMAEAKGL